MKLKFMCYFLHFREDSVGKKEGKSERNAAQLLPTPVLQSVVVREKQQSLMELTGLPEPQSWGWNNAVSRNILCWFVTPHCEQWAQHELGILKLQLSVSVTDKWETKTVGHDHLKGLFQPK